MGARPGTNNGGGPKTPEGRARALANLDRLAAVKHGFYCRPKGALCLKCEEEVREIHGCGRRRLSPGQWRRVERMGLCRLCDPRRQHGPRPPTPDEEFVAALKKMATASLDLEAELQTEAPGDDHSSVEVV